MVLIYTVFKINLSVSSHLSQALCKYEIFGIVVFVLALIPQTIL